MNQFDVFLCIYMPFSFRTNIFIFVVLITVDIIWYLSWDRDWVINLVSSTNRNDSFLFILYYHTVDIASLKVEEFHVIIADPFCQLYNSPDIKYIPVHVTFIRIYFSGSGKFPTENYVHHSFCFFHNSISSPICIGI